MKPPMKRQESRVANMTREAAVAFLNADIDGNQLLSFDEFLSIAPTALSRSGVQKLFNLVDTDNSGGISMDEFFFWSVSLAHESTGSGMESFIRKYDKTGEGLLDAMEFAMACEDMGFGS